MKKHKKKTVGFMAVFILLLSGCAEKSNPPSISINKTDVGHNNAFQKNMHQSTSHAIDHTCEAKDGFYFQYDAFAYYIDRETKSAAILCSKPECTHQDDTCNAYIFCSSLSYFNNTLYYTNNDGILKNGTYTNCGTQLFSMEPDGIKHQAVQSLELTPDGNNSQHDTCAPIIHNGYVYFSCNDALYRVPLGEDIHKAEEIFGEKTKENKKETFKDFFGEDMPENIENIYVYDPDAIHYTLWADGEDIYFMANIKQKNGSLKDTLFSYHPQNSEIKKLWQTPDASETGTWETTGVSVSQWYLTNGYLYFYLSGGDIWRADLENGKNERLAKTSKKIKHGTAIFSDQYICILNDTPDGSIDLIGNARTGGDTIFVYNLDGTFVKEVSLKQLYQKNSQATHCEMIFCSGNDIYFLADATTWKDFTGGVSYPDTGLALCCADILSGKIMQVYEWD